jgi:chromosome segregation ATPase
MTDQQPTIAELGAKFGAQLSQAYAELITLEKQIAAQGQNIQKLAQSEARLQRQIETIEAELNDLRSENFDLEELAEERQEFAAEQQALVDALKISEVRLGTRVQGLKAELAEIKTAVKNPDMPIRLSTAAAEIAGEAKTIINEKAAP